MRWIPSALCGLLLLGLVVLGATEQPPTVPEAVLHRAINLNGPAIRLDGRSWEAGNAHGVRVQGKEFENQTVLLRPPVSPSMAQMIRSSVFGSRVEVEVSDVPEGPCQVFVTIWEDNHSEQFDLLVNGGIVLEKAHTGAGGRWNRFGPFATRSEGGRVKVSARAPGHGGVLLSALEIWLGDGPVPPEPKPPFAEDPSPEQVDFFEKRIRPLFASHCYECHKAGARRVGGNLLLDSRAGILRGGDTGPLLTPGDPEASLLVHAVRHTDPQLTMPPGEKLSPDEVADLELWVRMGAPDPRSTDTVAARLARDTIDWEVARQWWSFQPVRDPVPPPVRDTAWAADDLDRFILARLEERGLTPAAPASPAEWMRRVTYGLTGLPPTLEALDAFLADPDPHARERVVDRLLASPAYGERWGRHWLDVVRYADTAGDNSDFPIPQIHRYRDWVVQALNRDLPYGEFIRDQIAGDLRGCQDLEATTDRLVATGYLAGSRRFGSRVEDYPQHLTLEDTIDNLGRAFLGLSLGCARCHDHKFDPVEAADYYALYGIFNSTRYPWPGIELDNRQRDLVPMVAPGDRAEAEAEWKQWEQEKGRMEREIRRLRDAREKADAETRPGLEAELAEAHRKATALRASPPTFSLAYAVVDAERTGDVPIQRRGDPAQPGDRVQRRFLTVLGGEGLPDGHVGSGRLELAEWIADPSNPLTARVLVNRIWLHHFGRGLVPTPNDFGRQGQPPTHPELLDWLASRLVESGGSMKALHRRIVLSSSYAQSGRRPSGAQSVDPSNTLYSGFPRHRLDAEALRDTLLELGSNLDRTEPGPHPFPALTAWDFTQHKPFRAVYETRHRSVYLMTQRIQRHPYLAAFDGADPSASTPTRGVSTTPIQALYLLNDPFVHDQARRFARRIRGLGTDDAGRILQACRMALGRDPDAVELDGYQDFLTGVRQVLAASGRGADSVEEETWEAFARVLYRLNEFAYVP